MTRADLASAALLAYVGGNAAGMVAGPVVGFWWSGLPAWGLAAFAHVGTTVAVWTRVFWRADVPPTYLPGLRSAIFAGVLWGAFAGAFAASTCTGTHSLFAGSEVAALASGLLAGALALAVDWLPARVLRPHALGAALYALTVALALALGAEVPAWP